jgi:hypothetical protein
MKSSRWFQAAALVALLAVRPALAAPTDPTRSSLGIVPAGSPIVVHIRGVEGLRDRVVAFLKNALPDVLPIIQPKIDEWIKDGINGRKVTGVPKDGPIFVVFTEVPKPGVEPPKMAILVTVSKFEEFRNGILTEDERKNIKSNGDVERTMIEGREPIYFVDRKTFAVVTPNEDLATTLAKKYDSIESKVSKAQAAKLLGSDLGVYINLDPINKEYGEQIKTAKDGLKDFLDTLATSAGPQQKPAFELLKKLIGPSFQALEDSQGVLFTAEVRPTGVAFHAETELRPGSTTAVSLKGNKPSSFTELEKMPAQQMFYIGTETTPQLLEMLGGVLVGVAGEKDERAMKAISVSLEQLAKAGPGMRIDSANVPTAGLQVWQFEDPAKAVAAQLKLAKSIDVGGTLGGGVLKEKPEIKENAEKYGLFTMTSVSLKWDIDKMMEQYTAGASGLGDDAKKQLAETLKKFLGDGIQYWFGTDSKVFVQVTAKDWATAEKLLDTYFKGGKTLGGTDTYRTIRKDLPAEGTMLILVDVVQYGALAVDVVKPLIGGVFTLPPGFPGKIDKDATGYVGVGVGLHSNHGTLDFVVSADAVKLSYKSFFAPFFGGGAD